MIVNIPNYFHYDNQLAKLPSKSEFFTDFIMDDLLTVVDAKKYIRKILSIKTSIEVVKTEICRNGIQVKANDSIISARLLRAELSIIFQVKYAGGDDGKSVFIKNDKFIKNVYITIPCSRDNIPIADLYRRNRVVAEVFVNDLKTTIIRRNVIKFSLVSFVNININT